MHTQLAFTCSYSFQATGTVFNDTNFLLLWDNQVHPYCIVNKGSFKGMKEARELLKLRCIIKSNIYREGLSTVSFRQLHYFIIYALHNKNSGTNQCVLVTHSPPFNANIT